MIRIARTALLLAFALAIPGCGHDGDDAKVTGTTTQKPLAQRLPGVPGLENFARVNPGLYRGGQPTEEGFKQLKAMGVKTVIDFRSFHSTKKQVEAAGLTPVEIPLRADLGSVPPDDEALKKFFEVVLDPARQPVYIHCAFGKDDLARGVDRRPGQLQAAHPVGLELQRVVELIGRHGVDVMRRVLVGGSVYIPPEPLDRLGVELRADAPGAIEHQVLEHVRRAAAPPRLVLGACVIPDLHRYHRRRIGGQHCYLKAI